MHYEIIFLIFLKSVTLRHYVTSLGTVIQVVYVLIKADTLMKNQIMLGLIILEVKEEKCKFTSTLYEKVDHIMFSYFGV